MAEVTNYIDRLVAELCPDGVEYRSLGDVVEYAKKREKDGTGVHLYVGVENLKSDFLGCSPVNGSKGGIIFQKDDILLGNIRPYLKKMWLSNVEGVSSPDVLVLRIQENEEDNIVAKYLYYILSSSKFVAYNISHSRGGKMPRGNKAKILEFEFPVPPMEIQEAIVEILDKFTNLEAELEAELEARTLQYEYYRDSLFEAIDCPRVPLGSFAQLVRGSGMPKTDFSESGVGAIHYGQIYTKFGTATAEVIVHVPEEKAKKLAVVNPGDVIVANTSENLEDVCKAVAWVGDSDIVTGGHATVIKAPEQNAKFISYYMATGQFNKDKRRHAFGTKVIDVAPKNLAKIEFPLPSLEEQQRIVDILDRFDALTSSLSEGLPAELAARRSQYEYYRDQLLTFPRKGENQ